MTTSIYASANCGEQGPCAYRDGRPPYLSRSIGAVNDGAKTQPQLYEGAEKYEQL